MSCVSTPRSRSFCGARSLRSCRARARLLRRRPGVRRSLQLVAVIAVAVGLLSPVAHAAKPKRSKTPRPFTLVVAGGSAGDGVSPTLKAVKARLSALDPKSTVVIFTGNYGASELPPDDAAERPGAERAVLAHVDATSDFVKRGGRVYFLPGHQDFAKEGTRAVLRLRALLNRAYEDATGREDDVMPQAACGTPVRVELTRSLSLLLLNSQWWMQEGSQDPELNQGCPTRTRAAFEADYVSALRDFRSRRLIIATHHPLKSWGELGGAFTAGAHLDPAPVLGSAWVLARQAGLVPQHHAYPLVRAYADLLRDEAERTGAFVFVSGHDASQQHLAVGRQAQLISGTSAREGRPVAAPEPPDLASGTPGWLELALGPDGEGAAVWRWPSGETLFEAALPAVPHAETPAAVALGADAPTPAAASFSKRPVWQLPSAVKLFTGDFYSAAFALKLPYEVLDLATEQGGLTLHRVGGSGQTNSLRARDASGGDWAIRSTTKDSTRMLPRPFHRVDALSRLLAHGYTANHPEAALAVAPLAQAAGLLHPVPRLMFLPRQERLGAWGDFISDEVVLLEQRPNEPDEGELPAHLGGAARFRDFDELLERLHGKPWKHHLDQEAMLRARLLDVLIGDWDRHKGQWRFAGYEEPGGGLRYLPVPIDRDQAFSSWDGAGLAVARLMVAQARSLQPYDADVGPLDWLLHNARDVDAALLNRLTREQWLETAAGLQAALTDDVIDAAFRSTWHAQTYALDGARIAEALKARRDQLPALASAFYARVAASVDVTGSEKDDRFELAYEGAGRLRVTVRARDQEAPFFERVFEPRETSELSLYALGGDDVLTVRGAPHDAVVVRFVGGPGDDAVTAERALEAPALHVYDSEHGARIDPAVTARDERSSDAALNQYDPAENHAPDFGTFTPGLLVNPDNGLYLGGVYSHVVPGWKQSPFAQRHDLGSYFATATLGAVFSYRGLFPRSAKGLDQQLDLQLASPSHTRNFFGFTNTRLPDAATPDWFRVRQGRVDTRWGLTHTFAAERSRAGVQLLGQAIVTEATHGRFVTVSPDVGPDALGPRYFAGARVFVETNTFDSLTLPRRGLALHASAEGRADVVKGGDFSITYRAGGAAAIPIDRAQRFVLLTRVLAEGIVGAYPFYFAPTLGELQLRAYRQEQLAGTFVFAHTSDLRVDVVRFESVLPGTLGINLAVDHGRAFGPRLSNAWHVSLGGGVWWSLVDTLGLGLAWHHGLDGGWRFSFAAGSLFSTTGF